jgi:hypothetical protein
MAAGGPFPHEVVERTTHADFDRVALHRLFAALEL